MSANAFTMLAVRPLLGRTLIAEDDHNGAREVVLTPARLWSRRYARDPAVIGRAVNLNGETCEIVGVLPASFALPNLEHENRGAPATGCRSAPKLTQFSQLPAHGRTIKTERDSATGPCRMEAIRQNLRRQYPDVYTGKSG